MAKPTRKLLAEVPIRLPEQPGLEVPDAQPVRYEWSGTEAIEGVFESLHCTTSPRASPLVLGSFERIDTLYTTGICATCTVPLFNIDTHQLSQTT